VPGGLEVFAISTLDEAIIVLQTIANDEDLAELPRCDL